MFSDKYKFAVRIVLVFLFVFQFVFTNPPVHPEPMFRPEFRDIEIRDFLKTMAQLTKKNILIDDTIKGKITIISHKSIPVSNALNFMKQVLEVRGFAVIEEPHLIKIVLKNTAGESTLPITDSELESGSGIVTKVIRLPGNASASEMQGLIVQLIGKDTTVAVYRPSNSLILTGYNRNVLKAISVIEEITSSGTKKPINGTASNDNVQIYHVKNMPAKSLEQVLIRLDNPAAATPGQAPAAGQKIKAVAHKESNSIIVTANQSEWGDIRNIIEQLDQVRTQILLEVLIAEVSSNNLNDFGIDWRYMGRQSGHAQFNSGLAAEGGLVDSSSGKITGNNTLSGFSLGFLDKGGELMGIFNANIQNQNFNVLSAPQVMTLDNQEAEINVGQDVPVQTQERTSGGGTAEATVNSFEYRPSGIKLRFTPHVSVDGQISLDLYTEVTNIEGGATAASNPIFNKRNVKTYVTVNNKQTIVIGGLVSNEKHRSIIKIPLLGDIPVLGHLFRRTTITNKKTNLMVFITPNILNKKEDADRISAYKRQEQLEASRKAENKIKLWPERKRKSKRDKMFKKMKKEKAVKP
ncbi:MAG: type II secretion system protein GspD [Spirochaetia bacterium]|nr:type II secretion system protein GspD [Spirochaetia bacterium]